jgi:hypothetical protein
MAKYGTPDLIGESAGDMDRFYLPKSRPEMAWRRATQTFYYLSRKQTVVFYPNGTAVRHRLEPCSEEEARRTIGEIAASKAKAP